MPYKDPDKQREFKRIWARNHRKKWMDMSSDKALTMLALALAVRRANMNV